jgi:CPA2 family monovalent cation:H+ antiporter-2
VLAGAQMQAIRVVPDSPADRKLIRELSIRSVTGASVVAIDRHGEQIVNPGPDEELRAGDRIFLLGTSEQIANAAKALGSPQPAKVAV